ncbi:MAG: hypothetical protein HN909_01525, partial [Phycisphaerales bacterium]|nr:hypothetical protein [Phycisphaerales bacterium]
MATELQQTLLDKLAGLRRAIRTRLILEAFARLLLALAALVAVTFTFDYVMHLDRLQRGVFLGLGVAAVVWVVIRRLVRPLTVDLDDESLALLVENRYPSLGDRLISALQFRQRETAIAVGMSGSMIDVVVNQANDLASQLEFGKVVEKRSLCKVWAFAAVALMLIGGAGAARSDLASLWFQRNIMMSNVDWPQDVYLSVLWIDKDGNAQPLRVMNSDGVETAHGDTANVLRGEDLQIIVYSATETNPLGVGLNVRYSSGESDEVYSPLGDELADFWRNRLQLPMTTEVYLAKIPTLTESVTFHATGGDDRLDARKPHSVNLIEPPALEGAWFTVEAPAYLRRANNEEIDGSRGVLSMPVGSILSVRGVASKPLGSVEMLLDGKVVCKCELNKAATTIRGKIRIAGKNVPRGMVLKFRLRDTLGYTNRRMEEYALKIEADRPPQFRYFRIKGVGQDICPTARIPIDASAIDAYGVGEIHSWYTLQGPAVDGKTPPISKPITIGHARPDAPMPIYLATWDLDIKPDASKGEKPLAVGTVIRIQGECADLLPKEFAGPNRVKSSVLQLRVISREDLLGRLTSRQRDAQLEFGEQAIVQQTASLGKMEVIAANAKTGKIASATVDLEEALTRQRIAMSESEKAADTFAAIAMEMELNRLGQDRAGKEREFDTIRNNIVSPLRDMVKLMREILTKIDQAKASSSAGQLASNAVDIAAAQAKMVKLMMAI